jgi:hypothetical protein
MGHFLSGHFGWFFFFRIKKLPWTYELGLDMSWASQLSLQSSVRAWIAELSG